MKEKVKIDNMSKKKFNEIFEAITDACSNGEYLQHIMLSESVQEIIDFLQIIHPGSYTLDDLDNFLKIMSLKIYENSKEYICDKIFKYTMWDIYKHYGINYLELFDQLKSFKRRKINIVHDVDLNVAGGIGGLSKKRFNKILASGLAVSVPLTSLGSSSNVSANETRLRSSKVEVTDVPVKKHPFLDWLDRHKYVKLGIITAGVVSLATLGYWLFDKYDTNKKTKKLRGKKIENLGYQFCDSKDTKQETLVLHSLGTEIDKITNDSNLSITAKKEKFQEELGCKLIPYSGEGADPTTGKLGDGVSPEWKEDVVNGQWKFGNSVINKGKKHIILSEKKDDKIVSYAYYIRQDEGKWKIEDTREDILGKLRTSSSMEEAKKKWKGEDKGINWKSAFLPVYAVGQCLHYARKGLAAMGEVSKSTTETLNLPKKAFESFIVAKQALNKDTWDALFPQRPNEVGRTYSVDEIYKNLSKRIKGQKEALWGIAQVLGAFIMKAHTSNAQDAEKNRQMTSGCNILFGPPGSGKSMALLDIKDNLPGDVCQAYLDLSKWDGKEAINTYLSKQKECEALLANLNGSYAVLYIEELDKICSTPEKSKKFNDWAHSLYDTGKLGGGEKTSPATLRGVLLFCTTNAIPEASDIEEGRVNGIKLDEGQTAPDVIEELALKGGRSIPQESHGSTRTRQKLFEFRPPDDTTLPDVIDSNLVGICDSIYASNKLDIQWNRTCLEKLASLIHTKKYMSGGNRKIVKDVLDKLWDLIIKELNPKEDSEPREILEDGTIRLWLDFEGVDQNGNLILSLANSEEEAKNKAEGLVMEDLNDQVEPLTPEMEKYILDLKIRYLSEALMSLSNAINIDKNRDWGSSLDDASKKCISDLASMISRSSNDVNENIKTIVQYRSNLLDTLKVQKINDSLWLSIKNLRSGIKNNLIVSMQEVKHSSEEEAAFKLAGVLLSNLKKYNSMMKLLGKKPIDFAKNNHVAITKICQLFKDFANYSRDPFGSLLFLLNLQNTDDMSREMNSAQIISISKLNEQVIKQLKSVESSLLNNAKSVYDTFVDISKLLSENKDNLDVSKALSAVDDSLISSLAKYVNNNIPDNLSGKLNFVVNNLEQIKPKLMEKGVSDDTVGLVLGIKSKIDNLIHPKEVADKKLQINNALSESFNRLKNISRELMKYNKLIPSLDDMIKADRSLVSMFIPGKNNTSNLDRIKYIANNSNDKSMIESINNAYSKGDITVDQFSDLVVHLVEFNNQILKKVEETGYEYEEDEYDEIENKNNVQSNENIQQLVEELKEHKQLENDIDNKIGNNSISTDINSIENKDIAETLQKELIENKSENKKEVNANLENKQNEIVSDEDKNKLQNVIEPNKSDNALDTVVSEVKQENKNVVDNNKEEKSENKVKKLIEVLEKKGMTVEELNQKLQDAGIDIDKLADEFNKSNIDVNKLDIDQIINELRNQKDNKKGNFADEFREREPGLVQGKDN